MGDGRQLIYRVVTIGPDAGGGYVDEMLHRLSCRKYSLPGYASVVQLAELHAWKHANLHT